MRRTTLGSISSSQLNAQQNTTNPSRLPLAKPLQPPASNRQSMTSVAHRRASVLNRSSLSRNSLSARMSMNGMPRGSQNGSGRRSSTIGGRGSRMTDPRPIADRNFMAMSIRHLIEFLTDRHYDHPISHQLLYKPMKKDFVNIMHFLFRELDPNYEVSAKIEEDVANCFRTLKYPFPISKLALSSVGSPHSWPPLLAAISWMIELLSYDAIVQDEALNNPDHNNGHDDDSDMFAYLTVAYKTYLSGSDDEYELMTRRMEESMDRKNDQIQQDTDVVRHENDELRRQIDALQNGQSLVSLNAKKRDFQGDVDKLQTIVKTYEASKVKAHDAIRVFEQRLAKRQQVYQTQQSAMAELQRRIDTQELSSDDLERMTSERGRLQEMLLNVEKRYKHIQASHWQKETEISQFMDRIEDLVNTYMSYCRRLKLDDRKDAHGVEYAIQIDAHSGGAKAAAALMQHLKKTIVPSLQAFRRQRVDRLDRILDKGVEAKVRIGHATSSMNEAVEAARLIDVQERKLDESIRKEQEAMDVALERKSREIEELELELERLQTQDKDDMSGLGRADKLLRDAKAAYADMSNQYKHEIESRLRFIQHAISMCIAFKEHATKTMTDADRYLRSQDTRVSSTSS
ncbi:hypothetical protein H257_03977 [Aphanomyces astaci]|uniref:Kinetochore protein NDC80 n=1 Tax=Aphanomyces astaci TaxID=112090 RepID=W4GWA7_APHAT|nr:hypothetical protein H257_03977 [Aphanomyces astaci]ETV83188.1 hypothetical protein H257_03977 [Aphanomyces astaci]|eukprot:XP_009826618.1 hypothetical protein H257_03977 [Aphanomyces astaci]